MIRISHRESIPVYHESVPLRAGARALGWAAAVAGIASGLALAGSTEGSVAEAGGPLLVVAGGVALAAVVRCRSYEVTIGTTRIEMRSGPFRRIAATGAVASTSRRPATAWRRLFADEEVLLRLNVRDEQFAVPSRNPAELIEALDGLGS